MNSRWTNGSSVAYRLLSMIVTKDSRSMISLKSPRPSIASGSTSCVMCTWWVWLVGVAIVLKCGCVFVYRSISNLSCMVRMKRERRYAGTSCILLKYIVYSSNMSLTALFLSLTQPLSVIRVWTMVSRYWVHSCPFWQRNYGSVCPGVQEIPPYPSVFLLIRRR